MNMARLPAWNRLFGRFFVAAILARRSAASNGIDIPPTILTRADEVIE
jgi:hypothetical protein